MDQIADLDSIAQQRRHTAVSDQQAENGVLVAQGELLHVGVDDSRRTVAYLLARESDEYIAVMDVLESSVTDMTPTDVAASLAVAGMPLDVTVVESRLDKLREWTAVSARTDSSGILRYADLMARNWRYTATPAGRQVQRFYKTVLRDTPAVREIPLSSLARVVAGLEALVSDPDLGPDEVAEHVGRLFTSHDDLDAALVGAEDTLAGLADRFDLDDERTAELKGLLVDYATRVAAELERGAARASRALGRLQPRFCDLAAIAVSASGARALIERGALTASRGGRSEDWSGLAAWFDPDQGRAARFALRLVRALPGMHANLRRLHTSTGTATLRARALAFARACRHTELGTAVFIAALGDHAWRKLHGAAADDDLPGSIPWRGGPVVAVPELLRSTGRSGPRGRAPAARDDSDARSAVACARSRRAADHADALREVLAAEPGQPLSQRAARVALAALLAAVRAEAVGDRRSGSRDGLTCTLFHTGTSAGLLTAPTWRVLLPGRIAVFHRPGTSAPIPLISTSPDRADRATLMIEGSAA